MRTDAKNPPWPRRRSRQRVCFGLNQLIGQYLRAQNARYGVYVLFRASANRQWGDNDGQKLDWPALLSQLQAVANGVVSVCPDIDNVVVLGIDVTPPTSPQRR